MMKMKIIPSATTFLLFAVLLVINSSSAWMTGTPPTTIRHTLKPLQQTQKPSRLFVTSIKNQESSDDNIVVTRNNVNMQNKIGTLSTTDIIAAAEKSTTTSLAVGAATASTALLLLLLPLEAANAADGGSGGGQIASALAAYGHYLSLFIIVGCLVTERLTVKANMSDEEEDRLAIADTTLGISGALLAYTGYLRTTADWGKGFDYYSHEPIFWIKILFVAIFGAVSFFPTTKIIQRSIDKRNGNLIPMSDELAQRMTSLINAELLMVGSIPLTATLMARGVLYMPNFPWQVGAGATVAALGGLGFKYVKEALDWKEPTVIAEEE